MLSAKAARSHIHTQLLQVKYEPVVVNCALFEVRGCGMEKRDDQKCNVCACACVNTARFWLGFLMCSHTHTHTCSSDFIVSSYSVRVCAISCWVGLVLHLHTQKTYVYISKSAFHQNFGRPSTDCLTQWTDLCVQHAAHVQTGGRIAATASVRLHQHRTGGGGDRRRGRRRGHRRNGSGANGVDRIVVDVHLGRHAVENLVVHVEDVAEEIARHVRQRDHLRVGRLQCTIDQLVLFLGRLVDELLLRCGIEIVCFGCR